MLGSNSASFISTYTDEHRMESSTRHFSMFCNDRKEDNLLAPILPWSDGLISWDSLDYGSRETESPLTTPSMTSGSSQPSHPSQLISDAEQFQAAAQPRSVSHYISTDYDLFPEYSSHGQSLGEGSALSYLLSERTVDVQGYSSSVNSNPSHISQYQENEDETNETTWGDQEDSIEAVIIEALSDDLPLAAYLIPKLCRNLYMASATNVTERVVPWREEVTGDDKGLQSPTASNTSHTYNEKRNRATASERDDEEEDGGGDDEDKRKAKRQRGASESERESVIRLACPFHKKDPSKYNIQFEEADEEGTAVDKTKKTEYRACAGPGFKNLQRLKEHLKRKHYPVQCDRCYQIFPGTRATAITLLQEHRQLSTPCERRPASLKEGISDAQWAHLDKKSKTDSANISTVEKWNHIWTVLFPDTPVPPSPWYDLPTRELTLPSEETHAFLDLFKQMLDYQVTQQDILFASDTSPEMMKTRVVSLVGKAFSVYTALNQSRSSTTVSNSTSAAQQPIFSLTSNGRKRTMSATSAFSSNGSTDNVEISRGVTSAPGTNPVTPEKSTGKSTGTQQPTSHGILGDITRIAESPMPSSDIDAVLPIIMNQLGHLPRSTHDDDGSNENEEEGSQG